MSLWALDDAICTRLAQAHGTPMFAYSSEVAVAGYRALRAVLPQRARIAYAVKANSHPELLKAFAGLGASFDCASIGELKRVAELKLDAGRTFFAGPGKRTEELELALSMGVRIQAEGWEDLERIEALALARGEKGEISVNVRIHPQAGAAETNRIIGGTGPSAFGVDEEDFPELFRKAQALKHVKIRGLHVFAASNQRDAKKLLATHAYVLDLAKRIATEHALELEQIDVGGGLGVPYSETESPLDIEGFGQGLSKILANHPWFTGELILEPGRFLAARCGVYLARVTRVKESRGTRFAILEGGINHLLRPLLTEQPFPVKVAGKAGPEHLYTLAGPLCTSLDRLGDVALPELASGDLLVFGTTGAYGFSEAMTHFLSHPVPPEVWVS